VPEILKGRDNVEGLVIDGNVMLKVILNTLMPGKNCTGRFWKRLSVACFYVVLISSSNLK
jgi:hypothetical protein